MSEFKNDIDSKLIEFQRPYLYRLKSKDKYNEDEEYRYRLLSNLLFTPYSQRDPEYLHFFGILPCELLPAAYLPMNYKNHIRNFNRLSKNDKYSHDNYNDTFDGDFNINDKKNIKDNLKKYLTNFENKNSLYNSFNYQALAINLIILWTIVIFMIMYVSLYYYAELFNYVLAIILTMLLVGSIIWKMIYTVQN